MEYSFTKNDLGRSQARLNMEAEAFGHWLSIDMNGQCQSDLAKIAKAVDAVLKRQEYEYEYQGKEFFLELTREGATVSANTLAPHSSQENSPNEHLQEELEDQEWAEEFDEELSDADSGLVASCGLEDFRTLIHAWIEFLE